MPALKQWQMQEAKNKLSEVVRLARQEPQVISLHGKPSAVVTSYQYYQELTAPKRSLVEIMRSAPASLASLIPERSADKMMRELGL